MKTMEYKGIVLLLVLVFGCMGCNRQQYDKHSFVLSARRPESKQATGATALVVQPFRMDTAFSKRGLITRISENEYKEDYYNEFLSSPADLVTDLARNWLSESGSFKSVLRPEKAGADAFVLEGDILAFYGDRRDSDQPKAVAEIRVTFLEQKGRNRSVLFSKKYMANSAWKPYTAEGLISGLDSCLGMILTKLEEDLQDAMKSQ